MLNQGVVTVHFRLSWNLASFRTPPQLNVGKGRHRFPEQPLQGTRESDALDSESEKRLLASIPLWQIGLWFLQDEQIQGTAQSTRHRYTL